MKKSIINTIVATAILTSAPLFAATADKLMVMNSWVRAAPPTAKVQAGFFNLMNHNKEAINLVAVEAQGFGYGELHLSSMRDGMMVMEKQEKITINGNSTLTFKPGSYHIMLLQPEKIVAPGELVNVTFTLANGEKFSAKMPVKRDNSKMGMKMNHGQMDHSQMGKNKMQHDNMQHN